MTFNKKIISPIPFLFAVITFVMVNCCSAAMALTLVENGHPRAEIVISAQPERTVRLAAQELQDYIAKISGARLPIVIKPSENVIKIFVGHSFYTDALKVTAAGLKDGAYRIAMGADWMVLIGEDTNFTPVEPYMHNFGDKQRAQDDWDKITGAHWGLPALSTQLFKGLLNLSGNTGKPEGAVTSEGEVLALWQYDERGSFNAVCGLLRKLGVRWYMPGELGEVVPKIKTISLSQIDETVRPDFAVRGIVIPFNRGYDAAMWYMRQGMSNLYGKSADHGMTDMTQNAEVFAAHPDWFAMYGGKRHFDPNVQTNQLCYSNEGLLQATVRYVRAQFDTYDYDIVSVMPPDGYSTICQCPLCEGKDDPDRGNRGKLSNYVWDFVNRVAKEIEKTNPGKKISCDAYGIYSLPPTNIARLEPNVLVKIVGGRLPIDDKPEEREALRQLRKGWLAKTDNLLTNTENYPFANRGFYLPAYQPNVIGESINEVKGFARGDEVWFGLGADFTSTTKDIGFNHFMLYFTARMYWGGKDADVDALFREYCRLFYSPAAQEMQKFFIYCEANWREMDKNKAKADEALALFATAKSKTDVASVYGKRIALIDDYLEGLRNKSKQLGKKRSHVPTLRFTQEMGNVVIDGKLDDVAWQDIPLASTGSLLEIETGQSPTFGTTFKVGWRDNSLYFAIRCEEHPHEKPNDTSTKRDDQTIWMGDCIEIVLETESHSYYQIAVSPSGVISDLDRSGGKLKFDWNSQAEAATYIGDGYWTAEIRIPVTADKNDPLHQVIGNMPTQGLPWFININRQRIRENGSEYSALSPTGTDSFHRELKFAYFYFGLSHQFGAEADDDYLNDISRGDYAAAAAREGITERQKSYVFKLAAARERTSKKWNEADEIVDRIPIEAVQKTVRMENLFAQGKASDIVENFSDEDIGRWPFWERGDGYFIRGKAFASISAGKEAVADYKLALEFVSDWYRREEINLSLGEAYEQLLKDDVAALTAYQAAYREDSAISGWIELGAVQGAARILTRQGKFDEALKELERINIKELSGYWRDSILIERAETLRAAGKKTEAIAIYKEIRADGSAQPHFHQAAEKALHEMAAE